MNVSKHLPPLFENEAEYADFIERHEKNRIKRRPLSQAKGSLFLGIDAGSTTTKAALIDEEKNLLYSFYKNNEGKPLDAVLEMLRELYDQMPRDAYIGQSTVTGYGEGLVRAAFRVDLGEIETIAHYKAAAEFLPGVDFILDIGGQDMKCMRIKDNAIYNIMLNEACSSGCGSFLETYQSRWIWMWRILRKKRSLLKTPWILVQDVRFHELKVKQAQKEGATIGDISAGLSYSVIRNALYKVIKLETRMKREKSSRSGRYVPERCGAEA